MLVWAGCVACTSAQVYSTVCVFLRARTRARACARACAYCVTLSNCTIEARVNRVVDCSSTSFRGYINARYLLEGLVGASIDARSREALSRMCVYTRTPSKHSCRTKEGGTVQ